MLCRLNLSVPQHILMLAGILLLFVLIRPTPASSQDNPYLEQLLNTARRERLHEERNWEVLLHYTSAFSGGYKSRIDDPKFFLSPDGRTDRRAELEAVLKSFFISGTKDGEHAACRFPARFEWLSSRLAIDPSQLPVFTCSERDKNLGAVEAKSAVLVFPVGHINSPASMFGHTLIRIDGSSRSNLISHAVNYAATATDSNGFLYAWKGLTGLYKGYYSLMPYYAKVKEYNDLEHRDMWEYRLRLSEDEVRKMLAHTWELHNISSSYYFFDENCSYNLLLLIEAARPELRLTGKTGIFVLPTHTIRIALESGILEEARYRPSQGTRIRQVMSLLGPDHQKLAFELAYSVSTPASLDQGHLSLEEKRKVLELAAEFAQFRLARNELGKDAYNRLYLSLLRARSGLGATPDGQFDISEPSRPETGHDTTKVAIGGGMRNGKAFVELEVQPQFHTLTDPDQGYLRGAQIKFLDTALRYTVSSEEIRLKRFHVLDIFSIAPRDVFFKPFSWKVNTGLESIPLGNGRDYLVYRLNTGGGLAWTSPFNGIWYAFGELDVNAGDKIRAGITIGPGGSIGMVEQITDWWKMHLFAQGFLYKLGDNRSVAKLSAEQNFRLTRNNSLGLGYTREFVNRHSIEEVNILWNHYF